MSDTSASTTAPERRKILAYRRVLAPFSARGCEPASTPMRMSPQCQQTTGVVYASITRRATAQRDIGDVCSADIMRLCGTSFADANLVECMTALAPQAMSPRCYQTFVDTGWATERARP
jgi:hypothetical protein